MISYYCAKCAANCAGRQCTACGRQLPAASMRDIWNVARVPAGDGLIWKRALCLLFSTVGLLALITLLSSLLSGRGMDGFLGALPVLLTVLPLGAFGVLCVLLLQGREAVWYILENTGVRMQTWHKPSRLHSWARLQSYRENAACPQPDGTLLTPAGEVTLAWKDIRNVKFVPQSGRIYLYRTPHIAPLILRIPREEYGGAEALIKKVCKGKY